ncbi:hypothetical protein [Staphylococcus argenteus]|uniref:hypothetical protein n=1 Tax=Staphylococcus argenteus TaxID=985002 RepID=UPI001154FF41|nr:hypothetical protein [Staphylococcus argenteus]
MNVGVNMFDKLNEVQFHIENMLDVKKGIVENPFFELAQDGSNVLRVLNNMSKIAAQKKFMYFLQGFNPEEIPSEEKLKKLKKYVNNEEKAMFISDTLSKIILSKSTYANMLLGYLLNYIIENNEDLDMDYLIVVDALNNLYDKDIINFKKIYSINSRIVTTTRLRKEIGNNNDYFSAIQTIEKLNFLRLIIKAVEIETNLNYDNDDPEFSDIDVDQNEIYRKNNAGKLLYSTIKKVKILN